MVSEVRIYYEGHPALREGFHVFFAELRSKASAKGRRLQFIAGGGGAKTVQDFKDALASHAESWNILLKDSEGPDNSRLFDSLCQKEGLPARCKDSVFWMVQLMEAWFLADVDALAKYYGRGFNPKAIGANRDIEQVLKADVYRKLAAATRNTTKRKYDETTKTTHAPKLLAQIDPERVKQASRNCHRMFETVQKKLQLGREAGLKAR